MSAIPGLDPAAGYVVVATLALVIAPPSGM